MKRSKIDWLHHLVEMMVVFLGAGVAFALN